MADVSFTKTDIGQYENQQYSVWDLLPRNVLKDAEGDIYIIDAEIAKKLNSKTQVGEAAVR